MSQKTPNLKQKIKRWIWVGHILFHLLKYELRSAAFQRNAHVELGRKKRLRAKAWFSIIKRFFRHSRGFVVRNKHLINKERFVFAEVRDNSLSL